MKGCILCIQVLFFHAGSQKLSVMLDHNIMVLVRYFVACIEEYRMYTMNIHKVKGEHKPTYNSNIHTWGCTYKLFSGGGS